MQSVFSIQYYQIVTNGLNIRFDSVSSCLGRIKKYSGKYIQKDYVQSSEMKAIQGLTRRKPGRRVEEQDANIFDVVASWVSLWDLLVVCFQCCLPETNRNTGSDINKLVRHACKDVPAKFPD